MKFYSLLLAAVFVTSAGEIHAQPSAPPAVKLNLTSPLEYQVLVPEFVRRQLQMRHGQELARLKGDVAVLRRDRENLQKAWDATKAELAKMRRPVETVAVVEVPASAPAAEVAAPPAVAPRPAASPVPVKVPAAPPAPLSRPAMPVAKPVTPPTGNSFPAPKPAAPTVKLVPAPLPVGQVRAANSSGVRPLPKPMPTAQLPKPAMALHPRTSVLAVHAPAVGPKGTQKLG